MKFARYGAFTALAALLLAAGVSAALAKMPVDGALLPVTPTLQSVIDGKTEPFSLIDAQDSKTVVLYFFPKAFTEG